MDLKKSYAQNEHTMSVCWWSILEFRKHFHIHSLFHLGLMLCMLSHSDVSNSLQPHGMQPARLLCPWGLSRQEYWSGLPCPPPGDLPTQESNPGLPHCRQILYRLSHQGSPGLMLIWYTFLTTSQYDWGEFIKSLNTL